MVLMYLLIILDKAHSKYNHHNILILNGNTPDNCRALRNDGEETAAQKDKNEDQEGILSGAFGSTFTDLDRRGLASTCFNACTIRIFLFVWVSMSDDMS